MSKLVSEALSDFLKPKSAVEIRDDIKTEEELEMYLLDVLAEYDFEHFRNMIENTDIPDRVLDTIRRQVELNTSTGRSDVAPAGELYVDYLRRKLGMPTIYDDELRKDDIVLEALSDFLEPKSKEEMEEAVRGADTWTGKIEQAAKYGLDDVIEEILADKHLREKGNKQYVYRTLLRGAMDSDNIDIFRKYYPKVVPARRNSEDLLRVAAWNGSIDIAKFLVEDNTHIPRDLDWDGLEPEMATYLLSTLVDPEHEFFDYKDGKYLVRWVSGRAKDIPAELSPEEMRSLINKFYHEEE